MMNNDDDEMGSAADDYLEGGTELDVLCPITNEPVIEGEKAYDFAGAPEAVFWKILAKRDMSALEYVAILKSGTEGVRFEGFTSNEGKAFTLSGAGLKSLLLFFESEKPKRGFLIVLEENLPLSNKVVRHDVSIDF